MGDGFTQKLIHRRGWKSWAGIGTDRYGRLIAFASAKQLSSLFSPRCWIKAKRVFGHGSAIKLRRDPF